jgi:hypothetical protein
MRIMENKNQEYMFSFEMIMNTEGKDIDDEPFKTIESISSKTEEEALNKIIIENNKLGYITLGSKLLKKETEEDYQERVNLEFNSMLVEKNLITLR